MKEFYYEIPNILGYAHETINTPNTKFLRVGLNGRILPNGVETTGPPMYYGRIKNPLWPYPQSIVAWNTMLLFHKQVVSRMNPGGSIGGLLKGFDTCNHPWSFAIYPEVVLACNAQTYVYVGKKGHPTVWGELAQIKYGLPVGTCICAYNGQMLIGAPWAYGAQHRDWIMWTKIGSVDARLEYDDTFEAGYHVTSYGGEVKALYSMSSGVVACSDQGITHLIPVAHPHMYMAKVITRNVGIAGPLAICGDQEMCIILGTDHNLYTYSAEGKFSRMGYRETLDLPKDSCPVLSYNMDRSEVYIGY